MTLSAKNKIVFSVVAFFASVILVMTAVSYQRFSESSDSMQMEKLDTIGRAVGKAVSEKTGMYFNALELAARQFNGAPDVSDEELLAYRINLLKQLRAQTKAGEAYFGLEDGRTFTAGKGLIPNFSAKKLGREWYKRIFAGEKRIITTPYTSSIGATVMAAGVPIMEDGKIAGTLCINLGLTDITSFANNVLDFKNIFLTREDGYIMANQDEKLIGKNLGEVIPSLKEFSSQSSGGRISFTINGERYEGSLYVIEGLNWKVWTYEKLEIIHSDSIENLYFSVITAIAALLLSALMVNILASALIFKPLLKGVVFATAVSEGRLDETLDVNQKDEVGALAEALRIMVARLKEMITMSENKTAEAEEESAKARQATKEADEARAEAEQAKRDGMLHAASELEVIVQDVRAASDLLFGQIDDASRGTTVQRERTAEAATAIEEMNATVLEVARNAGDASEHADAARQKAEGGSEVVRKVVESIGEVTSRTDSLRDSLGELGDRAQDVGSVMTVISDIADQTNLLALNAAIEAARAGEAGRGFAVVADEVRKLAEKTMHATKEVDEVIRAIQQASTENLKGMSDASKAVEQSTNLVEEAGSALQEIVEIVVANSDQVRSIATASEEQSAASEEISRNADEVNRIAEETADTMAQSEQAVRQLNELSQQLQGIIDDLKAQ